MMAPEKPSDLLFGCGYLFSGPAPTRPSSRRHWFGRLASLERALGFPVTYRVLAACYAHMGRLDEAREIVRRLRAITPVVVDSAIRYRNLEFRQLYLSGLRMAASEIG